MLFPKYDIQFPCLFFNTISENTPLKHSFHLKMKKKFI